MKKFLLALAMLSLVVMVATPVFVEAQMKINPPATAQGGTSGGLSGGSCKNLISEGLTGVVDCITGFFYSIIVLLIAAAVVYVVYGAFLMISNEEKRESGKQIIYYGIIGIFIMVSVWGFVRILDSSFGLSKAGPIDPPKLLNN
jgi:hypothetical protein